MKEPENFIPSIVFSSFPEQFCIASANLEIVIYQDRRVS
jgi:hypothetical protein